jgi:hypothetical protein
MDPLNDRELDQLLGAWRAPAAPADLEHRVSKARQTPWWQWLLTGTIRVPVPLTIAVIAALVLMSASVVRHSSRNNATGEFRPVKQVQVRIIRSSYENSY